MKLPGTKFKRQKRRWLFTQQMADMHSTLPKKKKKNSLDAKNLQEVKGIFDKYLEQGLLIGY